MMPPPAAEPPPPAAPPPAAAAKTWKDLITVDGLADAYYQYNFTGETSTTGPALRNFDLNSNTFTLNYAKVGIGVSADPVGLRIDLGYGATGSIINAAPSPDASVDPFLVQQAYASIVPTAGLTIDLGKFVTTAGAEVIEANKNWMYSRSFLFFNIPLLHNGVRATYKVSDALTLQASVVNGWNGVGFATDITGAKTYGVSINFTAPTGTNIIATGYFGKGEAFIDLATGDLAASTDTRVLGDLVIAHTMGQLGLNLNVDYVNDQMAGFDNFIGVSAMARYAVSDSFAIAGRGEYAKNGDVNYGEGTVTLAFPMAGRFEARIEGRGDFSGDPLFNGGTDDSQFTGTGALLAWF